MDFSQPAQLGRSGLKVGRLGIASSFRAPQEAYREAFERGCNYFTWGTFIKGRCSAMEKAVHQICAGGKRDDLVLGLYSYTHTKILGDRFLKGALKALKTDYIDVLLLGYYPKQPPARVMDWALDMRRKGLVRHLGLSSHNRKLPPRLAPKKQIDVFHIRYNAVHSGAEQDCFPHLGPASDRPGVVSFTATCWRKLLKRHKMPAGETPPSAADCYRFALSNDSVDVCMVGASDLEQMRQNLAVLNQGPMDEEELARMRRIGDHIYGRRR